MPTSDSKLVKKQPPKRGRFWRRLLGLLLFAILGWFGWVYFQIEEVAQRDEAQRADAIAVFGAAEYGGRPSPVLHARLDHAVVLYRKQIAPVIITLGGGSEKDNGLSEGGVGRDYLLANAVPFDSIIAETESADTEQQVEKLAEIAREKNFKHIVVVSDATHLFRIRELCRREALDVWTSPRAPFGNISGWDRAQRMLHEILSYTALRFHLQASSAHLWLEGK